MGDLNTMPHLSACYILRGQGLNYSLKNDIDSWQRDTQKDKDKTKKLATFYKETRNELSKLEIDFELRSAYDKYNKENLVYVEDGKFDL